VILDFDKADFLACQLLLRLHGFQFSFTLFLVYLEI